MKKKIYRNVMRKPKLYGKKRASRYEQIFDDKLSEYFREMASPDYEDLEQDLPTNRGSQDRNIFE